TNKGLMEILFYFLFGFFRKIPYFCTYFRETSFFLQYKLYFLLWIHRKITLQPHSRNVKRKVSACAASAIRKALSKNIFLKPPASRRRISRASRTTNQASRKIRSAR